MADVLAVLAIVVFGIGAFLAPMPSLVFAVAFALVIAACWQANRERERQEP